MTAYFIRHNIGSTPEILRQLRDDHQIALHYTNSPSTDPGDYEGPARKALKRLWAFCREGGIVGASYSKFDSTSMLVGELARGSELSTRSFVSAEASEPYVYKVAQLTNAKRVAFVDYPLLLGIQPRLAALSRWPSAEVVLQAAFHGRRISIGVSNLHPSQIETICYEYLRGCGLLSRLLMPIGRTMIDADILGIDENGMAVMAQVTYSQDPKRLQAKLNQLLAHATTASKLYFFAPTEALQYAEHQKITSISLENALTELQQSNEPATKAMLGRMFGGG